MNKRLKNKIEKRRRQKLCKILDLCLQINGIQESKQELTGNHPTTMFTFYGHVASVDIDIYKNGWCADSLKSKHLEARIGRPGELERLLKQLKNETPGAATPRESK